MRGTLLYLMRRTLLSVNRGTLPRMPVEIERKFLVANDGWRSAICDSEKLRDGLIGEFDGYKVRVRLGENRASIAVKGPRFGSRRTEFEYEIPKVMPKRCSILSVGNGVSRRRAIASLMLGSYGRSMCTRANWQPLFWLR